METWQVSNEDTTAMNTIREAASYMRTNTLPVGFPTETVYGLGADATRSEAVRGIFKVKGRPSDNPLIVHVCDLRMLRSLLGPDKNGVNSLPAIYAPLIERHWPGPLTILLPNATSSSLAPEVTAGLNTFGVRLPASSLALSLISLTGVPLAAPSANASTKPSPTTAAHVKHDLDGRIELILDGGACQVGVESTVVDGLCDPPMILRPGGLSIDDIRQVPGWEKTIIGYKDASEQGSSQPRAPGMKYKHYSPQAKVILFEHDVKLEPEWLKLELAKHGAGARSVGIVRSKCWQPPVEGSAKAGVKEGLSGSCGAEPYMLSLEDSEASQSDIDIAVSGLCIADAEVKVLDIALGTSTKAIAHRLFAALRALDLRGVDLIFVEGVPEDGDLAAAVMNRLRKAAGEIRRGQSTMKST